MDMGGWINWDGMGAALQAATLRMPDDARERFRVQWNKDEWRDMRERAHRVGWWRRDRTTSELSRVLRQMMARASRETCWKSFPGCELYLYKPTPSFVVEELRWDAEHWLDGKDSDDAQSAIERVQEMFRQGEFWWPDICALADILEQAATSEAHRVQLLPDSLWLTMDKREAEFQDELKKAESDNGDYGIPGYRSADVGVVAKVVMDTLHLTHPLLFMPHGRYDGAVPMSARALPDRYQDAIRCAVRALAAGALAKARNVDVDHDLLMSPWVDSVGAAPIDPPAVSAAVVIQGPWEHGAA